jgi:hypothetical protein
VSSDSITSMVNRLVTPEELREAVEGPITDAEREHTLALVRWFTTRYPSPEQRLAYVRRAYERWTAGRSQR